MSKCRSKASVASSMYTVALDTLCYKNYIVSKIE